MEDDKIMPRSRIIKDIVEETGPISKSMKQLLVLARDVGNKQIERWVEDELLGYHNTHDTPIYRRFQSELFRYSGINGQFRVHNNPLPMGLLSEEMYNSIRDIYICEDLGSVYQYAIESKNGMRDLTLPASGIAARTNQMEQCESIKQIVPSSFYQSVIAIVKNKMIIILCEIENECGCLDDLLIDTSHVASLAVTKNNSEINRVLLGGKMSKAKDEPWYTKVIWNNIIPILTGIVGAVGATLILQFFDEICDSRRWKTA